MRRVQHEATGQAETLQAQEVDWQSQKGNSQQQERARPRREGRHTAAENADTPPEASLGRADVGTVKGEATAGKK